MRNKSITLVKDKRITLLRNDSWSWFPKPFIQLHQLGKYNFSLEHYRLKIKPFFAWFDFYIGFYFDRTLKVLYFFPLPMIGIKFYFKEVLYCHYCDPVKVEIFKTAYRDAEGWALSTECPDCGDVEVITDWPFPGETVNSADLEAVGYEIV